MFVDLRSHLPRIGSRRPAVLAGVASVVLCAALPTWALAVSSHHVSITVTDARVMSGQNSGTSAGVFSGRPFGSGAVVQRVTVTSANGPVTLTKSSFTIFTTRGSIKGTGSGTRTINPNGSVTAVGTRTIIGGTGAFRGARGQLTVTGTTAANGITTSRWRGSVRY